MPRLKINQNIEKKIGGYCKIRKRVSSSSSTSSNYRRFKRAILVAKKTGLITMATTSKSPLQSFENVKDQSLSARKLGATWWEINGLLQSPNGFKDDTFFQDNKREKDKGKKYFEKIMGKFYDFDHDLLVDQNSHSPVCEKIDGSKVGGHRRRSSGISQKLQITEYIAGGCDTAGKAASSLEVASHVPGENNISIKSRLKDVNNSLIASKELVKVLFRILSQEEQQSSRLTLVSALKVELDRARFQLDQSLQEHRLNSKQSDALLKHFVEEKASCKSREKERIRDAVSSIAKELEIERKLRRQAERLNKKLGTELADTRAHLSRAVKELEGEKRSREILEQTCDELARGIGEERVEVEELKKESEKVREEVEQERQMLQFADVLREERVQMKLTEAKYEFEEKNAALERLRGELEAYLRNEPRKENGDGSSDFDVKIEIKDFLKKTQFGFGSILTGEKEDNEEDDSCDSELHSIELNMDNNNKSYKWNFVCDGTTNQGDSRRASIDEVFKGRKSLSEKIQWESICLQRKTSDGIEWDFTTNKQGSVNGFTNDENNEQDDDFKRYKPVKSRRLPSRQGSISPGMSTGKSSSRLREACSAILQDLASRRQMIEDQCVGNKR